jgi:hypothetical protein
VQLVAFAQRQKLLENGRGQRATPDLQSGGIDFDLVFKVITPQLPNSPTAMPPAPRLVGLDRRAHRLRFMRARPRRTGLGNVTSQELAAARAHWAFRSSPISTSGRRERLPPSPSSHASIHESSLDGQPASAGSAMSRKERLFRHKVVYSQGARQKADSTTVERMSEGALFCFHPVTAKTKPRSVWFVCHSRNNRLCSVHRQPVRSYRCALD